MEDGGLLRAVLLARPQRMRGANELLLVTDEPKPHDDEHQRDRRGGLDVTHMRGAIGRENIVGGDPDLDHQRQVGDLMGADQPFDRIDP